jgi:hypothetical protein
MWGGSPEAGSKLGENEEGRLGEHDLRFAGSAAVSAAKASPCRILLLNREIRRYMKPLADLFGSAGKTPALPANRKIKSSTSFETASPEPPHVKSKKIMKGRNRAFGVTKIAQKQNGPYVMRIKQFRPGKFNLKMHQ